MKTNRQQGFSLIELLIVVAIIGIIAAIAIPNLLASRRAANESAAIGSLRTIGSAEATYLSTTGNNTSYATQAELVTAQLIDSVLGAAAAAPGKSGYLFVVTVPATPSTFTSTAAPVSGSTGTRYFFADDSGVIRFATGAAATSASTPIQ